MSDLKQPSPGGAPHTGWRRAARRLPEWLVQPGKPETVFDVEHLEDIDQQLWELSPERQWYMKRRAAVFAGVAFGVVLLVAAALVGQPPRSDAEEWWAVALAIAGAVALGYSTFPYWAARLAFNERRRKTASYVATSTLREIRDKDPIPLNLLFAYNRRQLDAYQEEARNQQRLAFRYALLTSTLGFVVLLAGIAASFRAGLGTEAYVAGGLGAVGAALSAYVAGTMLRVSRNADERVNHFYLEPHMMGRLMLAERLMDSADGTAKGTQRDAIITQVLGWPLPGSDAPKTGKDAGG